MPQAYTDASCHIKTNPLYLFFVNYMRRQSLQYWDIFSVSSSRPIENERLSYLFRIPKPAYWYGRSFLVRVYYCHPYLDMDNIAYDDRREEAGS
jgi:hypothetical protein